MAQIKPGYDFSGWATRNDLKCSDGRTIKKDAFIECDGATVPLVWNHDHNEAENVLGHAVLENRAEGVYCYGYFNDTSAGVLAHTLVDHGDITALSIYANKLQHTSKKEVVHGIIREVSLVHAGANPGAIIDNVMFHSDGYEEDSIIMISTLEHGEIKEDEEDPMVDEEILEHADDEAKEEEEDKKEEKKGKTPQEILDSMDEDQKNFLYYCVGKAAEDAEKGKAKHSDNDDNDLTHNEEDTNTMKFNAFEVIAKEDEKLMHSEQEMEEGLKFILDDAKRIGSLRESFLRHSADYGINQIDWLYPDYKRVNGSGAPEIINYKNTEWVDIVINGVGHSPFAKVKMEYADIRGDETRARGYAEKGKMKKEQVFGLCKRQFGPTTVYVKQKIDRDDELDIEDFDVISLLRQVMKIKLNEELARAYIFGDGRSAGDEDKIKEDCINPAYSDVNFYTMKYKMQNAISGHLEDIIDSILLAQEEYEGSGNKVAFVDSKYITRMLLLKDTQGYRKFHGINDIAAAMDVNRIVKMPSAIMPNDGNSAEDHRLVALVLDLDDYKVGLAKGGAVNGFDDFDIDFNQHKYLMETRLSGGLTKPFSCIALWGKDATPAGLDSGTTADTISLS